MVNKIYGTKYLNDWTVSIKAGKATLRVNFTGGTTTVRGSIPATYSTTDPVKQAIIENSDYFKHGRIFVYQKFEMPDDARTLARKARQTETERIEKGEKSIRYIDVPDKAAAIDWLKENFPGNGYTATKLGSQKAFDAACAECGVVFNIG